MYDLGAWIKCYEGLKLTPYKDINGHLTIGWGRNLEKGIRADEAELMFKNDLMDTISNLQHKSWFEIQPDGVKNAIVNMAFNLGIGGLSEFTEMIYFLSRKNYTSAAKSALNSDWAKQVPERAKDIALMISEGK